MLRYGGVGFAISLIYSVAVIAAERVLRPIGPVTASIRAFGIVLPISGLAHGKISFGDRPRDVFQPLQYAMPTMATFIAGSARSCSSRGARPGS